MFCGNCGNKIDEGMKFCANCGAPVQSAAETVAPAVEAVQPAAETAAPAVEAVQPVAETVAPAVEAAQPVAETVAPAAETVQPATETVAPAVEAVQPAAETAAPAVEAVQQPVSPIEPLQPEQPVAPIPQAAPAQYAAPVQPVQPVQPAAPVQPVVKKKKSKAPLIAGLTAGAVLLGGGAAGYFFFHDDITRLIMGAPSYAKMIDKNYLKTLVNVDPNTKEYAGYFVSTIDNSVYSLTRTAAANAAENAAEDTANDAAAKMSQNALGFADMSMLYSFFDIIPEGSTLTTDSGIEVKLGSVFAMMDNETTRAVIDAINNLTFTSKIGNGDTDLMSMGIKDKNGHSGSVDVYLKDGGLLITFPGISEKKFYISKEEFDSAKSIAESSSKDRIKLDMKELDRLKSEIALIYYSYYDVAEITFTDNTEWVETASGGSGEVRASAKGNDMHISISTDNLKKMISEVIDHIKNDEYITSYVTGNFNITAEKFRESMNAESFVKNLNFHLEIDHIVDVHNNVLGSSYSLVPDSEKGEFTFRSICTDKSNAFVFSYSAEKTADFEIKCVGENKTRTDGNAVIVVIPDKSKDIEFALDCTYTGAEKKQFLGRDTYVGKYEIKLSDPDKFAENIGKLTGSVLKPSDPDMNTGTVLKTMTETKPDLFSGNKALTEELKKFMITYEASVEGDVLDSSSTITLGEIGSVSFRSRSEKKNEAVAMPDTNGASKIDDAETLSAIGADALNWLKGLAEGIDGGNGPLSKTIGTALNSINRESNIKKHYSEYTSYSKYEASNFAYKVSIMLDEQVRAKLSERGSKTANGVIKLYFKDGNAEIIDNGGIDGLKVEDSDLTSVYAEVFYDSRLSNGIESVTAVLTDDKNDLPDGLPTIDNFAQGVYPWEDTNCIGEFLVGVYPDLSKGDPDPNYTIPDPLDADGLNNYAELIGKSVSDYVGMSADISSHLENSAKTNVIAFMHDKNVGWYVIGGYADGSPDSAGGLKTEFIEEIKNRLGKLSDETNGIDRVQAALYFREGKFTGVMTSEGGSVYYSESNIPSYDDYYYGEFSDWSDFDGDDKPDPGYISDYSGNVIPIGTYSVPCHGALIAGNGGSAYGEGTRWKVTSLDGTTIKEFADAYGATEEDFLFYFDVVGDRATLSSLSGSYEMVITGETTEYEGETVLELKGVDSDEIDGYLIYDSDTTARLIDSLTGLVYGLEITDLPVTVFEGNNDSLIAFTSIDPRLCGTWTDGEKTYAISANGVICSTELYSTEIFIIGNPGDGSYTWLKPYDLNTPVASMVYFENDDTLNIGFTAGYTSDPFKRVDKAPDHGYTGVWKIDNYNGGPIADGNYMIFDIGEYAVRYYEPDGIYLYALNNTEDKSFDIVLESSMFIRCTYDPASDTISGELMFDEPSESIPMTMKRTDFKTGEGLG